ncbi:MAG: hypothetical protein WC852_00690 [Candidatus Nanoarchaeia archaeon]|jgi:hypothetical protein
MEINIGGYTIEYDGKKHSLLVSFAAQNCPDKSQLVEKVNKELLGFISLVPSMRPEHLVIVNWYAGYELGHPMEYYGIGVVGCKSIQPWKYHPVDHIIQRRNPFSQIRGSMLDHIMINYDTKTAAVSEGKDEMYNYRMQHAKIKSAMKVQGFKCNFCPLVSDEDIIDVMTDIADFTES